MRASSAACRISVALALLCALALVAGPSAATAGTFNNSVARFQKAMTGLQGDFSTLGTSVRTEIENCIAAREAEAAGGSDKPWAAVDLAIPSVKASIASVKRFQIPTVTGAANLFFISSQRFKKGTPRGTYNYLVHALEDTTKKLNGPFADLGAAANSIGLHLCDAAAAAETRGRTAMATIRGELARRLGKVRDVAARYQVR